MMKHHISAEDTNLRRNTALDCFPRDNLLITEKEDVVTSFRQSLQQRHRGPLGAAPDPSPVVSHDSHQLIGWDRSHAAKRWMPSSIPVCGL